MGEGGVLRKGTAAEVATQGSVNTRFGVERCARFAFELARSRRRHVTLVHRTNVLNYSGDLWQRTFNEVAAEHPEVGTAYHHVDAACIYMVESPQRYDVIVTDNLFGDILTDLAGAISGGIGRAASANLNPARTGPSLFEPVHGSAPDIAGTGKANPAAAIISAAMMLDYLGLTDQAARITTAVQGFAPDGPLTTSQFGDESQKGCDSGAHYQDRLHMDGRRARQLGRCQRPHPHPQASTTAAACLRASASTRCVGGAGRFPSQRPHQPALRLGQDLDDGHPV